MLRKKTKVQTTEKKLWKKTKVIHPKPLKPKSLQQCIEQVKKAGLWNIMVLAPGTQVKRSVCGKCVWTEIDLHIPKDLLPRRGTESQQMFKDRTTAAGENSGMLNDWTRQREFASFFLETRPGVAIAEALGPCVASERGFSRASDNPETEAHLLKGVHVDVPGVKWKARKTDKVPVLCEVRPTAGRTALVFLRQDTRHSVPKGGKCSGWFVKFLGPLEKAQYVNATWTELVAQKTKYLSGKQTYVWTELLDKFIVSEAEKVLTVQVFLAASVVFGLRPPTYPSGKLINVPQPFAGAVYKLLRNEGVRPVVKDQTLNPQIVLGCMRDFFDTELMDIFGAVAAFLPEQNWVVSPVHLGLRYCRALLLRLK